MFCYHAYCDTHSAREMPHPEHSGRVRCCDKCVTLFNGLGIGGTGEPIRKSMSRGLTFNASLSKGEKVCIVCNVKLGTTGLMHAKKFAW